MISPPVEIRRLAAADVADYREIRLAALRGAPEAFSSTHDVEAARPLHAFAERLESSIVDGAYRQGRIVGMAGLTARLDGRRPRRGFLWGMYVRPEVRRLGAAGLLLDAILAAGAAERYEQITLDVVADNHLALPLYERFGFVRVGSAPRAPNTESRCRDEIPMVKFLWPADRTNLSM